VDVFGTQGSYYEIGIINITVGYSNGFKKINNNTVANSPTLSSNSLRYPNEPRNIFRWFSARGAIVRLV